MTTPAFIIDEPVLEADLSALRQIADQAGCKLLYSPKACSLSDLLIKVSDRVDGFACSSVFELKLIERLCSDRPLRQLVSPLVNDAIIKEFDGRLDYLTVNSLSQWGRLRDKVPVQTIIGLRINPQISFIRDQRYDPCRYNSKLGVPLDRLAAVTAANPGQVKGITGLHFHSNCDETDFASLLATARHIEDVIPELLEFMDWINLGGGYLFSEADDYGDFLAAVAIFRERFGLEVFIEPGASVVRRAGSIEATVQDILDGDDTQIAILDATVNHMAEVFEFQFEPDVRGHVDGGMHPYILAGCTCLAGDVFGEYAFDIPLSVGTRVTFLNMGAYTMTKAHRFNGIALPTVYTRRADGVMRLVVEDSFDDFARSVGIANRATT